MPLDEAAWERILAEPPPPPSLDEATWDRILAEPSAQEPPAEEPAPEWVQSVERGAGTVWRKAKGIADATYLSDVLAGGLNVLDASRRAFAAAAPGVNIGEALLPGPAADAMQLAREAVLTRQNPEIGAEYGALARRSLPEKAKAAWEAAVTPESQPSENFWRYNAPGLPQAISEMPRTKWWQRAAQGAAGMAANVLGAGVQDPLLPVSGGLTRLGLVRSLAGRQLAGTLGSVRHVAKRLAAGEAVAAGRIPEKVMAAGREVAETMALAPGVKPAVKVAEIEGAMRDAAKAQLAKVTGRSPEAIEAGLAAQGGAYTGLGGSLGERMAAGESGLQYAGIPLLTGKAGKVAGTILAPLATPVEFLKSTKLGQALERGTATRILQKPYETIKNLGIIFKNPESEGALAAIQAGVDADTSAVIGTYRREYFNPAARLVAEQAPETRAAILDLLDAVDPAAAGIPAKLGEVAPVIGKGEQLQAVWRKVQPAFARLDDVAQARALAAAQFLREGERYILRAGEGRIKQLGAPIIAEHGRAVRAVGRAEDLLARHEERALKLGGRLEDRLAGRREAILAGDERGLKHAAKVIDRGEVRAAKVLAKVTEGTAGKKAAAAAETELDVLKGQHFAEERAAMEKAAATQDAAAVAEEYLGVESRAFRQRELRATQAEELGLRERLAEMRASEATADAIAAQEHLIEEAADDVLRLEQQHALNESAVKVKLDQWAAHQAEREYLKLAEKAESIRDAAQAQVVADARRRLAAFDRQAKDSAAAFLAKQDEIRQTNLARQQAAGARLAVAEYKKANVGGHSASQISEETRDLMAAGIVPGDPRVPYMTGTGANKARGMVHGPTMGDPSLAGVPMTHLASEEILGRGGSEAALGRLTRIQEQQIARAAKVERELAHGPLKDLVTTKVWREAMEQDARAASAQFWGRDLEAEMRYAEGPVTKTLSNALLNEGVANTFGVPERLWRELQQRAVGARDWDQLARHFSTMTGGRQLKPLIRPDLWEKGPEAAFQAQRAPFNFAKLDNMLPNENVFLPLEVARQHRSYMGWLHWSPEQWRWLPSFVTTGLNLWKFGATGMRLAYHARNFGSDAFNLARTRLLDPQSAGDLAQFVRPAFSKGGLASRATGFSAWRGAVQVGRGEVVPTAEFLTQLQDRGFLSRGFIGNQAWQEGVVEKAIRATIPTKTAKNLAAGAVERARDMAIWREDASHAVGIAAAMRRPEFAGLPYLERLTAAGNYVEKALYNYRRVAPAVRFLKGTGLAPFIAWQAKNIPAMFHYLLERPGEFAAALRVAEAYDTMPPALLTKYAKDKFNLIVEERVEERKDAAGKVIGRATIVGYKTNSGFLPITDFVEFARQNSADWIEGVAGPLVKGALAVARPDEWKEAEGKGRWQQGLEAAGFGAFPETAIRAAMKAGTTTRAGYRSLGVQNKLTPGQAVLRAWVDPMPTHELNAPELVRHQLTKVKAAISHLHKEVGRATALRNQEAAAGITDGQGASDYAKAVALRDKRLPILERQQAEYLREQVRLAKLARAP